MSSISKRKILVASPGFSQNSRALKKLSALATELVTNEDGKRFSKSELVEFLNIHKPEVLIVGLESVDETVIGACPFIKMIAKYGVGLDNIDLRALAKSGVRIGWTGGVNKRSVAELAMAFILGHFRNISPSIDLMSRGTWKKDGGRQIEGLLVGIVGFGHIGSEVSKLAKGLGMRLQYFDLTEKQEAGALGAQRVSYDVLLKTSDVITFHVPLTSKTRNMLSNDQLRLVKSNALIINTARGEVVDFNAVTNAVRMNKIGAYAADVFPTEPCDLSQFLPADHFYFTPHIGGAAEEAIDAMASSAIQAVELYCSNPTSEELLPATLLRQYSYIYE
jgi:phosphoglycerate dehydrogenase-like enzyme